jgi:hypothetical protein
MAPWPASNTDPFPFTERRNPSHRFTFTVVGLRGARDMPSDLDRPERWRALAAEALKVAKQLSDPTANRIMIAIAEAYLSLARRAEERAKSENSN